MNKNIGIVLVVVVVVALCLDITESQDEAEEELEDWEEGVVEEGEGSEEDEKMIKDLIVHGVLEKDGKVYRGIAPSLEMRTVEKPVDCVGPADDSDEVSVEYYRYVQSTDSWRTFFVTQFQ